MFCNFLAIFLVSKEQLFTILQAQSGQAYQQDKGWYLLCAVVLIHFNCHDSWTQKPGSLKQVDGGLIEAVWGVNIHDFIYRLRSDGQTWVHIGGRLKHVSAGQGGVWGVNAHDNIYYRHGTIRKWNNTKENSTLLFTICLWNWNCSTMVPLFRVFGLNYPCERETLFEQ